MAHSSAHEAVVTVLYDDGSRIEYDIPEGETLIAALEYLDKCANERRLFDRFNEERNIP